MTWVQQNLAGTMGLRKCQSVRHKRAGDSCMLGLLGHNRESRTSAWPLFPTDHKAEFPSGVLSTVAVAPRFFHMFFIIWENKLQRLNDSGCWDANSGGPIHPFSKTDRVQKEDFCWHASSVTAIIHHLVAEIAIFALPRPFLKTSEIIYSCHAWRFSDTYYCNHRFHHEHLTWGADTKNLLTHHHLEVDDEGCSLKWSQEHWDFPEQNKR